MLRLLLTGSLAFAPPQGTPAADSMPLLLQRTLAASAHPTMRWGNLGDVRSTLGESYGAAGWQPFWVSGNALTPAGQALLLRLQRANELGLDPADYDAARLTVDAGALTRLDTGQRAAFDIALSTAAARFATALHRGRADPHQWHPWLRLLADSLDMGQFVATLSRTPRQDSLWRALQPEHPAYWRLIDLLARYRAQPPASMLATDQWPQKLTIGRPFPAAARLRALLTALGEPAGTMTALGDTLYDSTLARGVMSFQKHQALTPDGVIGPGTRARLMTPWPARTRQIELTLERWRWLPLPTGRRLVAVNIPAMRLRAEDPLRAGGPAMLEMDVVIGKVVGFQTPMLNTVVSGVSVRPQWILPNTIARDEIRPKALADPGILARDQYVLRRGDSVLPPTPENIRRMGTGVEVRQQAGPRNALGQMKLAMANPANIYLHDSPERGLFGQPLRAFSHGCVRLANAKALGAFLLTGNTGRSESEWNAVLAGKASVLLPLTDPVAILLVYHTVDVDAQGAPVFYSDPYLVDPALDAALRRGYPYPAVAPKTPGTR